MLANYIPKSFFRVRAWYFAISLLVACQSSQASKLSVYFELEGKRLSPILNCELATTPASRQKGMMYRREMDETFGMLFVFADEQQRAFWMKNTYLTLDIIFLNADMRVVSIISSAKPHSQKRLDSEKPAKFVLEIPGGSTKKWGVSVGSILKVDGGQIPEVHE